MEQAKTPFVLGIVGKSDVGKTTLILKLIPELTKRGYKVGTVKNCPHGFDIDRKGKDSWKFSKEGSRGVLLTSQKKIALIKSTEENSDILKIIDSLFYDFDIVLVEGFSKEQRLKKVEILRKGISEQIYSPLNEVIAIVSDIDVKVDKPIFKPDQICAIVDFLEKIMKKEKKSVEIIVNGEKIFLNNFLQNMVKSLTLAMVDPLRRKGEEEIKEVVIKVSKIE
ncbi:molybdopterin-guanine dinucleotide biosynthesis protein B [Candidatus Aerophobetes bacterium]|nr:molybdopterin-guanine dinucleotide biosynthesis protein B [Candidatus Aerophobetes bacterium]